MTFTHPYRGNRSLRSAAGAVLILMGTAAMPARAQTTLSDLPVLLGGNVPGNLALTLSVEFPTALSVANIGNYTDTSASYSGYFDPLKCYTYVYNSGTPSSSYFQPTSFATGTNSHTCSGLWSGNYMNWATMQTIDPFRWALSGGYRSVDQSGLTILEKAWAPDVANPLDTVGYSRGSTGNFPYRGTSQASPNNLPSTAISSVTPFNWTSFNTGIIWRGNMMVFSGTGTGYQLYQYNSALGSGPGLTNTYYPLSTSTIAAVPPGSSGPATQQITFYDYTGSAVAGNSYRVYVRVRVCDPTTSMGVAGLEANCVKYGSNYKPEGLLQKYSQQIRYAALSYLDTLGQTRQGGVVRRPMNYIGPTYTPPLTSTPVTNTLAEWDPTTGVQLGNPDSADATASGVTNSGVINYLNSFGHASQTYMIRDNVSELYYAALRYYENLGNVPEWTNAASTAELDGFPALTTWKDPILYSCQKNFILGIGDDHTNYDYNVGGGTATDPGGGRPPKPTAVSNDAFNQASTWTTALQNLEGISPTPWWNVGGIDSTYYIAGLAYGAHITDLRSDLTGSQTVSTYWMDVEEGGYPENLNPYYLAAKYGGFNVPTGYTVANTTPLTTSWWDTTGNTVQMSPALNQTHGLPDNYFLAGNASLMVSSLTSAFANIVNSIQAYTTAFSFAGNNVTNNTQSFSSQYSSGTWTSVITASTLTFDSSGNATPTTLWQTSSTLQTQLAGTGWQSTGRRVATWNGSVGVPFEVANLTSAQLAALLPSYSSAPNATTAETNYLSYLRGDRTNEVGSTVTGSTKSLRARSLLLGDIVDAALTPVSAPSQVFSDASNPGYAAFKALWTNRPTMVYAGANDGMLHAFLGSNGTEQFAYVPSALYQGPTATPQVNGLAALGNPTFTHHFYVDATPLVYDIDLGHTGGTTGSPNWHSLLMGGLGKGGKSYYAIDVTNPAGMTSEALVAGNVKWEFTDSTMGYSFGTPVVVKTAQYGWVVALTSGYNSGNSLGYLYLVNPATGALLQKIATPSASNGLTQASAYVQDYSDDTADSLYVGDLNGQLWRFDLTAASGSYPAPTLLAQLTDASGNQQPITTAPLIEISPTTRRRYVLVGTGQLLSSSDIINANMQTFYAIIDGTAGAFNPVSSPITRAMLTPVSSTSSGVTLSPSSKGWYFDLGISGSVAWRVVINPVAYNGIVGFSALLTSGTDPCNPSGQSAVYAVNYSNATSVLTNQAPNDPIAGAVNIEKIFLNNGTATFEVGTQTGGPFPVPWNPQISGSTRLLNWREIPTTQ